MSSGKIERLFSQTGLILSKLRRKMKPIVLQSIVYKQALSSLKSSGMLAKFTEHEQNIDHPRLADIDMAMDNSDSDSG